MRSAFVKEMTMSSRALEYGDSEFRVQEFWVKTQQIIFLEQFADGKPILDAVVALFRILF